MKNTAGWMVGFITAAGVAAGAAMTPLQYDVHGGLKFVSAAALETGAGVAVKALPGIDAVAVCRADRCARVSEYRVDRGQISVAIESVARALGGEIHPGADANTLLLSFPNQPAAAPVAAASAPPGPGRLAPDFELPGLDGKSIRLSDYRGQRVLINSWASW